MPPTRLWRRTPRLGHHGGRATTHIRRYSRRGPLRSKRVVLCGDVTLTLQMLSMPRWATLRTAVTRELTTDLDDVDLAPRRHAAIQAAILQRGHSGYALIILVIRSRCPQGCGWDKRFDFSIQSYDNELTFATADPFEHRAAKAT